MNDSTKRRWKDRSRINMNEYREVRQWTKALGVDKDELARAVAKVGDSAAAVRKELATTQPATTQRRKRPLRRPPVEPAAAPIADAPPAAAVSIAEPALASGTVDAVVA